MAPDQHDRAGFEGYEAWREKRLAERLIDRPGAGPVAESAPAPWNHLISVLLYADGLGAERAASPAAFRASIQSLKDQAYRNIEIIVLGPGAGDELAGIDCSGLRGLFFRPELTVAGFLAEPGSEAQWRGDYALLAPAGVEFDPDTLALLNGALNREFGRPEIVTCDYDVREGDSGRREPHFLPGWDPDLVQSVDYLRSAFLVSRELIGRQRSPGRPASLHDWLRATRANASPARHLPCRGMPPAFFRAPDGTRQWRRQNRTCPRLSRR